MNFIPLFFSSSSLPHLQRHTHTHIDRPRHSTSVCVECVRECVFLCFARRGNGLFAGWSLSVVSLTSRKDAHTTYIGYNTLCGREPYTGSHPKRISSKPYRPYRLLEDFSLHSLDRFGNVTPNTARRKYMLKSRFPADCDNHLGDLFI